MKKQGKPQALSTDMENSLNTNTEQIKSTAKEIAYYLGKSVSWVYKLGDSLFFCSTR